MIVESPLEEESDLTTPEFLPREFCGQREFGGLSPLGLQSVGHDCAYMHATNIMLITIVSSNNWIRYLFNTSKQAIFGHLCTQERSTTQYQKAASIFQLREEETYSPLEHFKSDTEIYSSIQKYIQFYLKLGIEKGEWMIVLLYVWHLSHFLLATMLWNT